MVYTIRTQATQEREYEIEAPTAKEAYEAWQKNRSLEPSSTDWLKGEEFIGIDDASGNEITADEDDFDENDEEGDDVPE